MKHRFRSAAESASPRNEAQQAGARAPKPIRHFVVPLIVGCALFMELLDSTVIATALPVMARALHEDTVRLSLAITAYLFSLAVFIPVSGWIADRYGARRVFRCAIVIFTIGSVLCGVSQSLPQLVAARILQGFGGAMMTPVGRLVVLRSVEKTDLVQAMSYLTVPSMLGPVVGPPVGGFIVTYYSWRWIFFINVPICLIGIALVTAFVPDIKQEKVARFDLRGFLLTGVGMASLVFGFEALGRGVIPPAAIGGTLALGAACAAAYVVHARRAIRPIIDLALLRIRTFSIGVGGGGLFRTGMGGVPFLLAVLFQVGFGLSPLASGLLTFANAVGSFIMKFTVHPIVRAYGFRPVLLVNGVLSALSVGVCVLFRPTTPHLLIVLVLLAGGFIQSLQFTSLNTLSYADVTQNLLSGAATLASMAQQFFMSLGVTFAALILHLELTLRGGSKLEARDILPAFAIIGLVQLMSVLSFLPLDKHAGAEVSGKLPAGQPVAAEPAMLSD